MASNAVTQNCDKMQKTMRNENCFGFKLKEKDAGDQRLTMLLSD